MQPQALSANKHPHEWSDMEWFQSRWPPHLPSIWSKRHLNGGALGVASPPRTDYIWTCYRVGRSWIPNYAHKDDYLKYQKHQEIVESWKARLCAWRTLYYESQKKKKEKGLKSTREEVVRKEVFFIFFRVGERRQQKSESDMSGLSLSQPASIAQTSQSKNVRNDSRYLPDFSFSLPNLR